jgi:hypothetical protein
MTAAIPIRPTTYDEAIRVAFSAENDWGKQLAAARMLSTSPDWRHQNIARHIRDAYELHQVDLLRPVQPMHRDKADLRDQWRAEALETPRDVIARHADRWPLIVAGGMLGALVILQLTGWGL